MTSPQLAPVTDKIAGDSDDTDNNRATKKRRLEARRPSIAVPIVSKSAVTVLDAFIQHVVLQGLLPHRLTGKDITAKGKIVTDNGSEFKNELMQNFLKLFEG